MGTKGSEIAKLDTNLYSALVPSKRESILAAVRENLGDAQVKPFDLDRITVPAGGGLFWMVKSLDHPDGVPMKELSGILVYQKRGRSYWKLGLGEGGGGNTPPDCTSDDALWGVGDPGGDCATCALSQFGSDDKGRGQACSEKRMLFLLTPGAALPKIVMVPPSSLKALNQFMLRLASESLKHYAFEARLGLEKTKSADGIDYARITFAKGAEVPEETLPHVKEYKDSMAAVFATVPVVEAGGTEAE